MEWLYKSVVNILMHYDVIILLSVAIETVAVRIHCVALNDVRFRSIHKTYYCELNHFFFQIRIIYVPFHCFILLMMHFVVNFRV